MDSFLQRTSSANVTPNVGPAAPGCGALTTVESASASRPERTTHQCKAALRPLLKLDKEFGPVRTALAKLLERELQYQPVAGPAGATVPPQPAGPAMAAQSLAKIQQRVSDVGKRCEAAIFGAAGELWGLEGWLRERSLRHLEWKHPTTANSGGDGSYSSATGVPSVPLCLEPSTTIPVNLLNGGGGKGEHDAIHHHHHHHHKPNATDAGTPMAPCGGSSAPLLALQRCRIVEYLAARGYHEAALRCCRAWGLPPTDRWFPGLDLSVASSMIAHGATLPQPPPPGGGTMAAVDGGGLLLPVASGGHLGSLSPTSTSLAALLDELSAAERGYYAAADPKSSEEAAESAGGVPSFRQCTAWVVEHESILTRVRGAFSGGKDFLLLLRILQLLHFLRDEPHATSSSSVSQPLVMTEAAAKVKSHPDDESRTEHSDHASAGSSSARGMSFIAVNLLPHATLFPSLVEAVTSWASRRCSPAACGVAPSAGGGVPIAAVDDAAVDDEGRLAAAAALHFRHGASGVAEDAVLATAMWGLATTRLAHLYRSARRRWQADHGFFPCCWSSPTSSLEGQRRRHLPVLALQCIAGLVATADVWQARPRRPSPARRVSGGPADDAVCALDGVLDAFSKAVVGVAEPPRGRTVAAAPAATTPPTVPAPPVGAPPAPSRPSTATPTSLLLVARPSGAVSPFRPPAAASTGVGGVVGGPTARAAAPTTAAWADATVEPLRLPAAVLRARAVAEGREAVAAANGHDDGALLQRRQQRPVVVVRRGTRLACPVTGKIVVGAAATSSGGGGGGASATTPSPPMVLPNGTVVSSEGLQILLRRAEYERLQQQQRQEERMRLLAATAGGGGGGESEEGGKKKKLGDSPGASRQRSTLLLVESGDDANQKQTPPAAAAQAAPPHTRRRRSSSAARWDLRATTEEIDEAEEESRGPSLPDLPRARSALLPEAPPAPGAATTEEEAERTHSPQSSSREARLRHHHRGEEGEEGEVAADEEEEEEEETQSTSSSTTTTASEGGEEEGTVGGSEERQQREGAAAGGPARRRRYDESDDAAFVFQVLAAAVARRRRRHGGSPAATAQRAGVERAGVARANSGPSTATTPSATTTSAASTEESPLPPSTGPPLAAAAAAAHAVIKLVRCPLTGSLVDASGARRLYVV